MSQHTIVRWERRGDGWDFYGVYRATITQPGPVKVLDLGTAEKLDEIQVPVAGADRPEPLLEWAQAYETPDFPALDWRKT